MVIPSSICDQLSDQEAVAKALEDVDYFSCIFQRYEAPLLRYVKRIFMASPDEAEDVLQDAFIKIWRNLRAYDPSLKLSTWLYRIVHNEAVSALRKKRSYGKDKTIALEDAVLSDSMEVPKEIEYPEGEASRASLLKLIGLLPQKYRTIIWLSYAMAVVLGGLAFSIILFVIQQIDFQLLDHLSHSRWELFLGLLPFLWIAFLLFFLLIAMYGLRYSKRGYKFTLARMAGYSAALSILLGTAFFTGGGAQRLEQAFAVHVSIYESVEEKKVQMWSMPEQGYLGGTIESVSPVQIKLTDFAGKSWEVNYDAANWPPSVKLEVGETIKLIGEMKGNNSFRADALRPWGGQGRNRK